MAECGDWERMMKETEDVCGKKVKMDRRRGGCVWYIKEVKKAVKNKREVYMKLPKNSSGNLGCELCCCVLCVRWRISW